MALEHRTVCRTESDCRDAGSSRRGEGAGRAPATDEQRRAATQIGDLTAEGKPFGALAVFLDKDGTLVDDLPYNVDPERITLAPGAAAGTRLLTEAGFRLVVVTNQSGVAQGRFPNSALAGVETRIGGLLAEQGAALAGFYHCPHDPHGSVAPFNRRCACRKPADGLLRRAARELAIDLEAAWLVGDILDDVEAGRRAGCRTILLNRGGETEWRLEPQRIPHHIAPDLYSAAQLILSVRGSRRSSGTLRRRAEPEAARA